jgi:hypothetical protein
MRVETDRLDSKPRKYKILAAEVVIPVPYQPTHLAGVPDGGFLSVAFPCFFS